MMDWLANPIVHGAIGTIGVPAVLFLFGLLMKPERVRSWGYACGKVITTLLRQKIGKSAGEKIEGRFQSTINDFIGGLHEGMDFDD